MSDVLAARRSNITFAGDANLNKGLVKLDLTQLEDVVKDLYSQNYVLRNKIEDLRNCA